VQLATRRNLQLSSKKAQLECPLRTPKINWHVGTFRADAPFSARAMIARQGALRNDASQKEDFRHA
jgi:hypothetical protein